MITLPDAIRKMTGWPGITDATANRGTITIGNWADVTIFDYDALQDKATYEHPMEFPDRDRMGVGERRRDDGSRKAHWRESRSSVARSGSNVLAPLPDNCSDQCCGGFFPARSIGTDAASLTGFLIE